MKSLISSALAIVTIGLVAFTSSGATAVEGSKEAAPRQCVIGISPFLEKSAKDDVYRGLVRLVVEDLPPGSTLAVYDAFALRTITEMTLPKSQLFNSPKTRANQFASAIRDLKQFLAQEHARPTNSPLRFAAAIRLPQFLDFLAEHQSTTDSPISVLIVGSPLYQDSKEPAFSMVDGYFPSDGHLQVSREKSVFGFTQGAETAPALFVHWFYNGDPWVNDLHKEKVSRFWSLYLERRGARMAAFTGDLPTALQGFQHGATGTKPSAKGWAIDTSQTKIEMLRVGRTVEVADWLTSDSLSEMAQVPPSTMIGPMKIGIRWKAKIDVDLYATPRPGAVTLFFQQPRSPEGYYYKDHRSSPGKEYEFIEFESPVDIREVEAYINFYKGYCSGGPRGEVRIEFEGRIYGGPFSIPAEEGNLGRAGGSQQEFWTRVPVQELLKIAPPVHRGG